MTDYEIRLGRDLRAASEYALRSFDAAAITRSVATGAGAGRGWARVLPIPRRSWAIVAILVALALVGGTLLVGGLLPAPPPTFRLGHLVYELDGDIWVADGDGGHPVRIADGSPTGRQYYNARWSADGRILSFFASSTIGSAILMQADGDGQGLHEVSLNIDEVPGYDGPGYVSPSGDQRAAYLSTSLMVRHRDGRSTELHAPSVFLKWDHWNAIVWTPDERRVILGACTTSGCKSDSAHELFSVPLSGAIPTRLTPSGVIDHGPTVSPDGNMVAFMTPSNSGPDHLDGFRLGFVGVDGTNHRVLPDYVDGPLVWAPDSGSVAATREGSGIWIISVDAGVPGRLLADTANMTTVLAMSPDGRWILGADYSSGASLWRVEVDGPIRERLVDGTFMGDWQRVPDR
jgi:Tol biopolymer transport system component